MPQPCSVCAHHQRAEIDQWLSAHQVNMAEIARRYGLKKDAVRRHRAKHLPAFLPAFVGNADPLDASVLNAEAQRLYLVALDALAHAEAGVLVDIDPNGKAVHRVSSSALAAFMREARASLDLLVKLAAATPSTHAESEPASATDTALDARIHAALDRVTQRAIGPIDVVDAEVIEDNARERIDAQPTHTRDAPPTQPPLPRDLVRADPPAPVRDGEAPFSRRHQNDETRPTPEVGGTEPEWKSPTWTGSPAATEEERRAAGFGVIPTSKPLSDSADDELSP